MAERKQPAESAFPVHVELIVPRIEVPKDFKGWACEIKWNGVRAAVFIRNGQVSIMTKSKKDLRDVTGQFPELVEGFYELANVHPKVILDGEIIYGSGKTDKDRTHVVTRINSQRPFERFVHPAGYRAFDLLYLDGIDYRNQALTERVSKLSKLFSRQTRMYNIKPNEVRMGAMMNFIKEIDLQGYEGVVLKRKDSFYNPRTTRWLKYRFPKRKTSYQTKPSTR